MTVKKVWYNFIRDVQWAWVLYQRRWVHKNVRNKVVSCFGQNTFPSRPGGWDDGFWYQAKRNEKKGAAEEREGGEDIFFNSTLVKIITVQFWENDIWEWKELGNFVIFFEQFRETDFFSLRV